jgi:hypothetical protein
MRLNARTDGKAVQASCKTRRSETEHTFFVDESSRARRTDQRCFVQLLLRRHVGAKFNVNSVKFGNDREAAIGKIGAKSVENDRNATAASLHRTL